MEADTLEKSLIFVFVHVLKLHPTNHIQTLLTPTPPLLPRLSLFGLSCLSTKWDSEGRSKGENSELQTFHQRENLLREVSALGHILWKQKCWYSAEGLLGLFI